MNNQRTLSTFSKIVVCECTDGHGYFSLLKYVPQRFPTGSSDNDFKHPKDFYLTLCATEKPLNGSQEAQMKRPLGFKIFHGLDF